MKKNLHLTVLFDICCSHLITIQMQNYAKIECFFDGLSHKIRLIQSIKCNFAPQSDPDKMQIDFKY